MEQWKNVANAVVSESKQAHHWLSLSLRVKAVDLVFENERTIAILP